MYGVLFQVMNAGFENEFFLLKSITRYGIQYYISCDLINSVYNANKL
jgi:hypothetical protein